MYLYYTYVMINITNEAIQLCNGLQKSDFKTIKQKNVLAEDIQNIYVYGGTFCILLYFMENTE